MAEPLPDNAPMRYAYKPSLMGSLWEFELGPEALLWRAGRRRGAWPYADIVQVRLRYRPQPIHGHAFRADIRNSHGQRVTLLSTTWQGIAALAPQDDAYRAFLAALHGRLAQERRAQFVSGMTRTAYLVGLGVTALLAVAMLGLLARALAHGEMAGAAFLVGFAALFAWQFGGFMRRNRPAHYAPETPPPEVLP